ncbi:PEGA domain-containing protein [Marivirga harenae]|uniref:PEGA domain-containing protein n=1 Tax=Marivirga harenae TaxID=2010992 RepID=UPI0026E0E8B7|nr:PEGA domain-containing protein [Marivirga harenae]WKV10633.1 PEGA domain-containing protein [Marivirga harenae]|tara:strand:- start:614651 stop:615172 length:522 start_codon:yes stop_codon:yes gene_type:complete
MRKMYAISLFVALIACSSCATIFTGTKQKVSIDSNPQGAKIVIDGQNLGVTPAKVKVDRELDALLYGGKEIQFELDGYKKFGYELDARFNTVSIINFFNPLFWGIDIASGAVTQYDNYYNFQLIPLEFNNTRSITESNMEKYEKLIQLKKLLEDGVITQKEFEKEKAKVLAEE